MNEWTEEAERLRWSLPEDPLLQRFAARGYVQLSEGGQAAKPIKSVRDVVGEQRAIATAVLHKFFPFWDQAAGGRVEVDHDRYGVMIARAVPYLWTNKVHGLLKHYNMPKHIVAPDLPHPIMWWTFEGSIPITNGPDVSQELGLMDGALLFQEMGHIKFVVFGVNQMTDRKGWAVVYSAKIGAVFPDEVQSMSRDFLSMLAFVNSPFIETPREVSHKKGAKVKWHGRRIGDPVAMHVVRLRSSVHEAVAVERGEGPKWKSRWLVRGHYRAQWYAKTGTHKVIWIAPYLKGPEDAPLEAQAYAVVR